MDTLQNTYKDDDDDGENSEQEPSQTMQTQIQTNPSIEPDSIQIDPSTETITTQFNETITTQIKAGIALSNPNFTTKIEFESNPELMGDGSSENPTRNVSPGSVTEDEQNPECLTVNGGQDQIQTNPLIELDPMESDPSIESNSIQISKTIPTQFNNGIALSNPYLDPKIEPESLMAVESPENPTQDVSSGSISENEQHPENVTVKEEQDEETRDSPSKKQKPESNIDAELQVGTKTTPLSNGGTGSGKKYSKKKYKGNNVWTKSTSRKGKKKAKNLNGGRNGNDNGSVSKSEDTVLITPMPRFPDRNDDSPEANICLSKVYKAEKVELSEDRLIAGSCKGYRMVRATRGVSEGAWFFEIKVVSMGETGHTRLGWSTEKGDLQGPVGYDGNSFGYRDIDGSKIHKALREKYGEEGYKEGDVIGFYISLPDGDLYASKSPRWVWYKGQKYVCAPDPKEDLPKVIPGSEISFYKNGICQGIAFKDLFGGRYYPAASMYTLPNQPNCVVKFNFGPDFDCFPADLEGRPVPKPMIEVPYHGFDNPVENGVLEENKSIGCCP